MSHAYPISSLLLSVFLFSGHNAFGMLKAYKIDPNETTADIHSEYLQKKAQYKNALVKNQRTEILMASLDAEPKEFSLILIDLKTFSTTIPKYYSPAYLPQILRLSPSSTNKQA